MPTVNNYPRRIARATARLLVFALIWGPVQAAHAGDEDIITRGELTAKTIDTFTVDSVQYQIDSDTEFKDDVDEDISFGSFELGDQVKAKGEFNDGVLLASSLELEQSSGGNSDDNGNEEDDDSSTDEYEIKGLISEISESSITVQGQTFSIDGSTKIVDEEKQTLTVADLALGDKVAVEFLGSNSSLATKIKLKLDSEDSDNEDSDVEVVGLVTALNDASLVVRDITFVIDDATRFESDNHMLISRTDLVVGDLVKVEYIMSGEQKLARKIELEGDESEFEIKGPIASITDDTVTVRGTTATLVSSTRYRGPHGTTKVKSDFVVGQLVKLQNTLTDSGYQARELKLLDHLRRASNFDDNGSDDKAIFRQTNGTWYLRYRNDSSDDNSEAIQWGLPGDVDVAGEYDGDGRTDLAVFRPSVGTWFILTSSSGFKGTRIVQWGLSGDEPIVDDFDGDAIADIGIWRPSTGTWYILLSKGGNRDKALLGDAEHVLIRQWGLPTHRPRAADIDGDGRSDLIVIDEATGMWYSMLSSGGFNRTGALSGNLGAGKSQQFGLSGDKFLAADFDGDGIDDETVYRLGIWYIRFSSNSAIVAVPFGLPGDVPGVVHATSDDSDGRARITVYRPSEGNHYDRTPLGGVNVTQWGLPNTDDRPVGDYSR